LPELGQDRQRQVLTHLEALGITEFLASPLQLVELAVVG
jgi:hypothetical protein